MRIFIVEDELLVADYLRAIIERQGHELAGTAENLADASKGISGSKPDAVFLDIRLADGESGIRLGNQLADQGTPFVYITANTDPATMKLAAATRPFGYLSKPFHDRDIQAVLEMLQIRVSQRDTEEAIQLKTPRGTIRLAAKDILYIAADNVYVEIITRDKVFVERATLKTLEDKLSKSIFVRVHRSYLVNKLHVKSWTPATVTVGEKTLPLSSGYKAAFFEALS